MRSPRPKGREGPRRGLHKGIALLGALVFVFSDACAAPPPLENRHSTRACFLSSKFPEAPGYRHNSLRAFLPCREAPRSLLIEAILEALERADSGNVPSLFSERLRPERWLALTAGPSIDEWIDYYAYGPERRYLEKAITRSASYVQLMESIIREEGLPPEVLALVYIESGFDPAALSHKRAAGPWQFMRRTAGRFGLRVGRYVDERRDPELSTRAAARYLRYLHGLFDSWTLAAASYNSGEGRVLRAVKAQNTRDFWSLKLPRQTREFVPKVAAVLAILSDPGRYGFELPQPRPLRYDVVEVNGPVKLSAVAAICGSSQETLELLNPALIRGMTPPGSVSFLLRVPAGTGEVCTEELSKIRYHMVSKGETLSRIASEYDVSVRAIARANAISDPNRIRRGALLTIPPVMVKAASSSAAQATAAAEKEKAAGKGQEAAGKTPDILHYTVRPGDNLWRISIKFGTSVAKLASWNDLSEINKLRPGQVLKIFLRDDQPG